MTNRSEAAKRASRENGRRSKGPVSIVGKQISARNAFKHGLRGRQTAEPLFMLPWLRLFDQRVTALFGFHSQGRREHLERAVEHMLMVQRADPMVNEELRQLGWLLKEGEALPGFDPDTVDLSRLPVLISYRRRFGASRDRSLCAIVDGKYIPRPHDRITSMQETAHRNAMKKKKAAAERAARQTAKPAAAGRRA